MENNLYQLKNKIPAKVKIIVVTKGQNESSIKRILDSGHINFAENKVQEAEKKWLNLKKNYTNIKLHMIGHLQTNKVRQALKIFDCIETIDSYKLAKKISDELKNYPKKIDCYIQINTTNNPERYGIKEDNIEDFLSYCINECNLNIIGFMTINQKGEKAETCFKKLFSIYQKYQLKELSMGMSGDYIEAIKYGATQIRIGRAIFSNSSYEV